jgi:ATP adenylyltransferase
MKDVEGCVACDLIAGRKELVGGCYYQTDLWVVEHCIGPFPLGTLILKPRRHCLHIWDLNDAEAAELGPMMRRVSGAIPQLVEADQVYCFLWSHMDGVPGHIHYVLQPARNVDWGKDIQHQHPGTEAIEKLATIAREVLRGQ